ncbi:MAG: hypothetical protein KF729_15470 [Sandaracinaceae bacterium]|nr:hypothetical protein [Sandaracinaceae bacterium]
MEEEVLVGRVRSGEVLASAQICPEGDATWSPLASHPPFASALSAAAPASRPSPVAATMAMPGITPQSMPGMLGSLSGPGASPAPHTPPPGALPPIPASSPGTMPAGGITPAPIAAPPGSPYGSPHGSSPGHVHSPGPHTPSPHTPMPGTPAPGYSPPSVAPPGYGSVAGAPAPKKSKMPLFVGGGCALLLVATICIAAGSLLFFGRGSSAFATRSSSLAEIIRSVAVDGRHAQASDWACVSGEDLQSSPSETRAAMAPLGSRPEIALTAVSLHAAQGRRTISALALVFPDGRVRYSSVRTRDLPDPGGLGLLEELYAEQLRGWSTGRDRDREMLEGVDELLELLSNDDCDLEWVSSSDLEGLPTALIGDIMQGVDVPAMREACNHVGGTAGWARRIDAISVVVRGNDRTAILTTSMSQTPGTSVCVAPVRARVLEEESD